MAKQPILSLGQRLLLASQGLAPLAVKVPVVLQLGPQRVAQMAPHMPAEQLRELIIALPIDFLAQATVHLDPRLILEAYLSLPDSLHLEVARQLCDDRQFATAARYAECLSAKQLKVLIFGLNSPENVLQIARHIQDMDLIVQALRTFSSGYLCKLTEAALADGNGAVVVRVLGGLPLARQADVCANLHPNALQGLLLELLAAGDQGLREYLPVRLLRVIEQSTGTFGDNDLVEQFSTFK
ncbi:hypothetical protein D3880_22265 [Pseudomonas cavernae]|uniref:Uncharacterized protein n=1 Tax=Pseudomonas cavernae TaxID=2320867 RepID=A0A385Z9L3_9PSED|nr:hypothetical protein [Pseudomonas cavernae]AYC34927.1 hypothetical protein D3880_22265 [Pseudomonas cavernae]